MNFMLFGTDGNGLNILNIFRIHLRDNDWEIVFLVELFDVFKIEIIMIILIRGMEIKPWSALWSGGICRLFEVEVYQLDEISNWFQIYNALIWLSIF